MTTGSSSKTFILDALAAHTVRSILFPSLHAAAEATVALPGGGEVELVPQHQPQQEPIIAECAPVSTKTEDHHARVLGYCAWREEELELEKKVLKTRLRTAQKVTTPPETELQVYRETQEAYALVKLLLEERRAGRPEHEPSTDDVSLPLLHAQLVLYARYFQKVRHREILDQEDVAPVQQMHDLFVQRIKHQQYPQIENATIPVSTTTLKRQQQQ